MFWSQLNSIDLGKFFLVLFNKVILLLFSEHTFPAHALQYFCELTNVSPANLPCLPALRRNWWHESQPAHGRTCVGQTKESFNGSKSGTIRHQNHPLDSALARSHHSTVSSTIAVAHEKKHQKEAHSAHFHFYVNFHSIF